MQRVLEGVLDNIVPTEKERENVDNVCEQLRKEAESLGDDYDVMFCGSIAKDTWLQDQKDIDMFLLFDDDIGKEELEERGKELGKTIIDNLGGEWEITYAEHPYVQGVVDGYEVDIVPAYNVESGRVESSVDRTPWHVRWVEDNLDSDQKDEVRLLKKFLKEQNLYGSDLKTRGFSGYLCEILIERYGSFKNLLESSSGWGAGEVVDVESHYSSVDEVRDRFENSALLVVDPIDSERNVASVLSSENFFLFKKKSKIFMNEPSEDSFSGGIPEDMAVDVIESKFDDRGTEPLLIKFKAPDVHQDVLFPQMRKMNSRIREMLENEGFEVLRTDVWSDGNHCILMQEFEIDELPRIDKRRGPSIYDRKNSEKFIERYGDEDNLLIENDRWYAEYWRDITSAVEFVRSFFEDDERSLPEKGVPRHLADKIDEDVTIRSGDETSDIFGGIEGFRRNMSIYFDKDLA